MLVEEFPHLMQVVTSLVYAKPLFFLKNLHLYIGSYILVKQVLTCLVLHKVLYCEVWVSLDFKDLVRSNVKRIKLG